MNSTIDATVVSYNRPHLLERALKSVASQRLPPHRLILADCSDNPANTSAVNRLAKEWKSNSTVPLILIRTHPPLPQAAHTRKALKKTTSDLIAVLHDDDEWENSHLAEANIHFTNNPKTDLFIANTQPIDDQSNPIREPTKFQNLPNPGDTPDRWFKYFVKSYFGSFSSYVFKRQAISFFPPFESHVLDHAFATILSLHNKSIHASQSATVRYRVPSTQRPSITSQNNLQTARNQLFLKILRDYPTKAIRRMPSFPIYALKAYLRLLAKANK